MYQSTSKSYLNGDGQPPTVLEYQKDYKVLRQIASGAFGSVHCVQRRDSKVIHAAKYVNAAGSDLDRELDALKCLRSCKYVLQFVAFYQAAAPNLTKSVLVTEFLAGGDLIEKTSAKDYILNEQKCRNIVRQICQGVEYIHSQRFIHLDLKPSNIVFAKKRDDYDLRIIDYGLAMELGESPAIRLGKLCGTIEYMSPEVMDLQRVSSNADMWGVGCITFQLLSGGISPFFAHSRYRTMAKVLDCDYSLEQAELSKTSPEAKDFISMLLIKDPNKRLTASQCLSHIWLRDETAGLGVLQTLETRWMRRCLARRRWYRLFNAVRVFAKMRAPLTSMKNSNCDLNRTKDGIEIRNRNQIPIKTYSTDDSEEENLINGGGEGISRTPSPYEPPNYDNDLPPFLKDISTYYSNFEKLHLISNNGPAGTIFSVQRIIGGGFNRQCSSNEVYSARHVRCLFDSLRLEAGILYQLRNVENVIQLEGLYEGTRHSVLMTDFLGGGDLVERVSQPDFILNEAKCKKYVRQICSGLQYIHKNNILHLDIKPFSIVFVDANDDSELKIADFNVAKRLEIDADGSTLPSNIECMSGTVEFMSPEMIECTSATTKTDCWGLGIIAYMLITGGQSPFYGGSRFRTIARILTCQYHLGFCGLKHISHDAKHFIRDLLQQNPEKRMSASACLRHPWLTREPSNIDTLYTLETTWMKQLLARRRWHRWFNAVRAAQRIRKFSAASSANRTTSSTTSRMTKTTSMTTIMPNIENNNRKV